MLEIKGIHDIGRGRWIIHYETPTACHCSFIKGTLVIEQKKKPSEAQAKTAVENELNNKG